MGHLEKQESIDGKTVTSAFSMTSSFQVQSEWVKARKKQERPDENHTDTRNTTRQQSLRWQPPIVGTYRCFSFSGRHDVFKLDGAKGS